MGEPYFTARIAAMLRRSLGLKSSMNVWDKSMTEPSTWDLMRYEAQQDMKFLEGNDWPKTATIKKPQHYA